MAKFCGNCGTKLDDSAKVCGNCGTPLKGMSAKTPEVLIVDPEKKKKLEAKVKKIVKLCVAAVALILVAVLTFNLVSNFTGHKGLLRKVMNAVEKYEIEELVSMSSDAYYFAGEDYADFYFESNVGSVLDYLESSVGHGYKLSYEVYDVYTLSNRNMESLLENIAWDFSEFDASIVGKAVVANVTLTAKNGKDISSRDLTITMVKENGSWRLLYLE